MRLQKRRGTWVKRTARAKARPRGTFHKFLRSPFDFEFIMQTQVAPFDVRRGCSPCLVHYPFCSERREDGPEVCRATFTLWAPNHFSSCPSPIGKEALGITGQGPSTSSMEPRSRARISLNKVPKVGSLFPLSSWLSVPVDSPARLARLASDLSPLSCRRRWANRRRPSMPSRSLCAL